MLTIVTTFIELTLVMRVTFGMIFTAFWLLEAFTSHILAASFPFTSR
jgi:hypothetical protein